MEQEITSRGASYLAATSVPAKDLQAQLCPGPGEGQATATISALGSNVGVVASGHLDLATKSSQIVVDSLQVDHVPAVVGRLAAGIAVNAASIDVSSDIREIAVTSRAATLEDQR